MVVGFTCPACGFHSTGDLFKVSEHPSCACSTPFSRMLPAEEHLAAFWHEEGRYFGAFDGLIERMNLGPGAIRNPVPGDLPAEGTPLRLEWEAARAVAYAEADKTTMSAEDWFPVAPGVEA